jgi:hypothetical protein
MGFLQTLQNNDMVKIVLVLVAVYFFMQYSKENLENLPPMTTDTVETTVVQPTLVQASNMTLAGTAKAPEEHLTAQQISSVVAGPTQLTTADLLPKYSDANDFAKQNPVSKLLQEQNFLQSGYHMGINTVLQTNRIGNLDLRSLPPIVKNPALTGPWNQSSIEMSGGGRRFFEIGQ